MKPIPANVGHHRTTDPYRLLFEHAGEMACTLDLHGAFTAVNPAGVRLTGYPEDELIGTLAIDLIAEEARPEAVRQFARRLNVGAISTADESILVTRDGGRVPIEITSTIFTDDAGAPVGVLGLVRDMSERRAAATALLLSEERFRSAFDHAAIGMALVGLDGRWLQVNGSLCRLLGLSRDELLRKTAQDVTHPDDLEADRALVRRLLAGTMPTYQLEKRYFDRDGNVVWVLSSVSLVRTADGSPSYFINQIEDISERRQAEADRDRLRDELHHAHKLEAIGRLAAGVAHDFNNMLTAIEGYSDLLLDKLDPRTAEYAHASQIRRAAEQAATLPRQLLAFGRKQTLEPAVVDLRDVVRNIDELLRSIVSARVRLETVATAPALAYVDADKLEQALINLVVNARDAMPDGGRVSISIGIEQVDEDLAAEHDVAVGGYSFVRVEDTGHGIAADTMTKIFEPFFTTKPSGLGSGLGLASVYGTVNQSGGFIRVESEPGKGARFEIFLPTPQQLETQSRERTLGVLLAEDEPLVRDLAVSVLEGGGFEVRAAANGQDALALFDRDAEAIDVVVTDMVMPEMGGLDLAERVLERRPETPIVYMSGYTDEDLRPDLTGAAFRPSSRSRSRPRRSSRPFEPQRIRRSRTSRRPSPRAVSSRRRSRPASERCCLSWPAAERTRRSRRRSASRPRPSSRTCETRWESSTRTLGPKRSPSRSATR